MESVERAVVCKRRIPFEISSPEAERTEDVIGEFEEK